MLRLDFNENPRAKVFYTRPEEYEAGRRLIARYAGVRPNEVVITNGSYQALDQIFSLLFGGKDVIALPVPTFPIYLKFLEAGRRRFSPIPYRAGFSASDIIKHLKPPVTGLYIANPNNPIGYQFSKSEMVKILAAADRRRILTIVDEAYFEFGGVTVKDQINRYPRLIVVRTLSKAFGLGGARVGYITTNRQLAEKLNRWKGETVTISRLGLAAAARALGNLSAMRRFVSETKQVKKQLENFCRRQKIEYFPGQTNFLTIRAADSTRLVSRLAQQGIMVKDLTGWPDADVLLKNCLRLTVPPARALPRLKKILHKSDK